MAYDYVGGMLGILRVCSNYTDMSDYFVLYVDQIFFLDMFKINQHMHVYSIYIKGLWSQAHVLNHESCEYM